MVTADRWQQRIRDPVHGLVVFGGSGDSHRDETDRVAWSLLNTREFQRLRHIRQLGFSDLVFPGATHSRFAHSIGVYHTARRLVDIITRLQGEQQHDPGRARVALLAALLHDIGHGPFSHAFEAAARVVGLPKRHEEWSAEIVQDDTEINRVLRDTDEALPDRIARLLKEEEPKDIYATVVSSQFDADRLDYIQRDRMATGVEFGHVDYDWLLDCLEVGTVTIGRNPPREALCLYLGPKGLSVAEEYLEARFRLYRTVYMHKTTRAAEKMLESLLHAAASELRNTDLARRMPVLRYLISEVPSLDHYLALDDAAVWSALMTFEELDDRHRRLSELSRRLRERKLYKCVDIGIRDEKDGNLYLRFQRLLDQRAIPWRDALLFDEPTVTPYKWYDFDDASALNKVLVKTDSNMDEPIDIAVTSTIVKTLRNEERIQRAYAPEPDQAVQLLEILREIGK